LRSLRSLGSCRGLTSWRSWLVALLLLFNRFNIALCSFDIGLSLANADWYRSDLKIWGWGWALSHWLDDLGCRLRFIFLDKLLQCTGGLRKKYVCGTGFAQTCIGTICEDQWSESFLLLDVASIHELHSEFLYRRGRELGYKYSCACFCLR
jgi:hypothetical protein